MKFCIPPPGLEEITMEDGKKAVGLTHKGEFVILNQQLQKFKDRILKEVASADSSQN